MMVVKFKNSEEGNHFLRKLKKMKVHFEDMIECLEDKIQHEEEDYEDDYDEPSYRTDANYRGSQYRSRYRMR